MEKPKKGIKEAFSDLGKALNKTNRDLQNTTDSIGSLFKFLLVLIIIIILIIMVI